MLLEIADSRTGKAGERGNEVGEFLTLPAQNEASTARIAPVDHVDVPGRADARTGLGSCRDERGELVAGYGETKAFEVRCHQDTMAPGYGDAR